MRNMSTKLLFPNCEHIESGNKIVGRRKRRQEKDIRVDQA